jgi:hypothetical protein
MVALFGGQPFLSMSQVNDIRKLLNQILPNLNHKEQYMAYSEYPYFGFKLPIEMQPSDLEEVVNYLEKNGHKVWMKCFLWYDIYGSCCSVFITQI